MRSQARATTSANRRQAERGAADAPPGESAAEALARARQHALRALSEALEAGRALVDAASLAATGARASDHPLFAGADAWIAGTSQRLARGGGLGAEIGPALAEALDAEIARWQQRAAQEEEARAVLRAFLGLREILWEVGVRPAAGPADEPRAPRAAEGTRPRRTVERVAVVQG